MNREALLKISAETRRTSLNNMRIEDVFFTGILREKAKVSRLVDFDKTPVSLNENFGKLRGGATCFHDSKENSLNPR